MDYGIAWKQLKKNAVDDLAKFEKGNEYLRANICRVLIDSMDKIENSLTSDAADTRKSAAE